MNVLRRCFLAVCATLALSITVVAQESAVGPLMKLFQSGRLPPARQPAVVEMICNRGNASDLKVVFDKVIADDGFPPELRQQAMAWLADAAKTRKVQPEGDLSALAKLVVSSDNKIEPAIQKSAIKLASVWKVASVSKSLQALATDPKTPADLQRTAISGLIDIADPGSKAALEKLATAGYALPIRLQAVAGLASVDIDLAAKLAIAVLKDAEATSPIGPMLDAFFQQQSGVDKLAVAITGNPPSKDVAKTALRYMYSVGRSDASLSNALSAAAGIEADPAPPTPEEIAQLVADVTAKGDPVRGEQVFRSKDLSCMKCHSVSRAGGQIGPDLSAVGGSSPVDYVVNSILNPNLAIKEQYVTRIFVLDTGKVVTGVVLDRDDVRVQVRDASGQIITVPTADIDDEAEGKSLMPQGLTKFLTRDELVDLSRFVSELGKPGHYAVIDRGTIHRWRSLLEPAAELTQDVPHLEHVRQFVLGTDPAAWGAVYSRVDGTLPLAELRPSAGPQVIIVKGEVEVRTAGHLKFEVRSTEKFQAWVDEQAFDSKPEFMATLSPGRHAVILRIELSDRANPELSVKVSSPDDSSAKYEIVAGS